MPSVRGLVVPALLALLLGGPLPAGSASAAAPVPGAGEVPRVQLVKDPRGDVRTTGRVPASVSRSVDVRSLQVRRDFAQLRLRFAVADVRSFASYQQRAVVVLANGALRQRFTAIGSRVLKGDLSDERVCGSASRRADDDVVVVRLPFDCLRVPAGELLALHGEVTAVPTAGGGRASDRTRSVRTDPR